MSARDVLLATTNPAKLARLRWVFSDLELTLHPLPVEAGPAPDEEGTSFADNAALKVQFWSRPYPDLVAASDGGLMIPALGERWNALRTARAAGPDASDVDRARHLLDLASTLRGAEREVHWIEALAIGQGGQVLASWSAEGSRAMLVETFEPEDLRTGFWAASLCFIPDRGLTLADLPEDENSAGTWAALRQRVRAYFSSGQPGA